MAISLQKIKHCIALSVVVLVTAPLSGCIVPQSPSKSALEVGVHEPVGKSKTELTKLVDANPLSGRLHRSADAYIGKVSPAIFNQLKYLPLIAPAYVPDSFSLVKYDIPASGYVLIYGNNTNQCFAIEYDAAKRLTADNSDFDNGTADNGAASDTQANPVVGPGQSSVVTAGRGNEPAELPELSAAGAPNSSAEQPFLSQNTAPAMDALATDTPDFAVFDSPLFGPGQKLFHGEDAEKMAASELSLQPNQPLASDEAALDFLAAPDAEPPEVTTDDLPPSSTGSSPKDPAGATASASNSQDSFVSQWLRSEEGAYRYVSGSIVTQNYPAQNQCDNVSLEEGVKIVTSLAILSADSTGALESNPVPSDNF